MDSPNNDGLRGTPDHIFHLIDTFKAANPGAAAAHLDGAMHTKHIFGNKALADAYQRASGERLSSDMAATKAYALAEIRRFAQKMRNGDWQVPTGQELYIKVKDQIYRPAHMIVHSLAQYYGIKGTSGREQIDGLVQAGKMSSAVAYLLINLLEDAGRLRMDLQLAQGQEFEVIRMRNPQATDSPDDIGMVTGLQNASANWKGAIADSSGRLKILLGMAEAFVSTKSRGGRRKSDSPFKSPNPSSYRV